MGFEWTKKEAKFGKGFYHHVSIDSVELGVLDADPGLGLPEFIWEYMGAEDTYEVTDITLEKQKEFCETLCRYKLESIYLEVSKMRSMI